MGGSGDEGGDDDRGALPLLGAAAASPPASRSSHRSSRGRRGRAAGGGGAGGGEEATFSPALRPAGGGPAVGSFAVRSPRGRETPAALSSSPAAAPTAAGGAGGGGGGLFAAHPSSPTSPDFHALSPSSRDPSDSPRRRPLRPPNLLRLSSAAARYGPWLLLAAVSAWFALRVLFAGDDRALRPARAFRGARAPAWTAAAAAGGGERRRAPGAPLFSGYERAIDLLDFGPDGKAPGAGGADEAGGGGGGGGGGAAVEAGDAADIVGGGGAGDAADSVGGAGGRGGDAADAVGGAADSADSVGGAAGASVNAVGGDAGLARAFDGDAVFGDAPPDAPDVGDALRDPFAGAIEKEAQTAAVARGAGESGAETAPGAAAAAAAQGAAETAPAAAGSAGGGTVHSDGGGGGGGPLFKPAERGDHAAQAELQEAAQRAAEMKEALARARRPPPASSAAGDSEPFRPPIGNLGQMVGPEHVAPEIVVEPEAVPAAGAGGSEASGGGDAGGGDPGVANNGPDGHFLADGRIAAAPPAAPFTEHQPQVPLSLPEKDPLFSPDELFWLTWTFDKDEKSLPYVGHPTFLERLYPGETPPARRTEAEVKKFPKEEETKSFNRLPWSYYNLLAVFPGANEQDRMHGVIGVQRNGTQLQPARPLPPAAADAPGGKAAALQAGGFYQALSDALPLDRVVPDTRPEFCPAIEYDLANLPDASVVITFYNEPVSTLMRSVHTILNYTPPSLLREIILVDDHSDLPAVAPKGIVYEHLRLLPKVKLMRLGERRGIVTARLAGAKLATAPVLVILDSHIEAQAGWLEPLLQRIHDSPRSLVFPVIPSLDADTLAHNAWSGIGARLSFKWKMQERPFAIEKVASPDAVSSAGMAGGLWAMRRDFFWDLGGYDDKFEMWGAENVEMAFRTWMCGGRVEGVPCSRVYHIFRHGGSGYTSPSRSVFLNRLRTARLWTGEYFQLAKLFITTDEAQRAMPLGSFDRTLALQRRLGCKDFRWFLDTVDPGKIPRRVEDVATVGTVRHAASGLCFDTMGYDVDGSVALYPCHGQSHAQFFMTLKNDPHIYSVNDETRCIGGDMKILDCYQPAKVPSFWRYEEASGRLLWEEETGAAAKCLTAAENRTALLSPCIAGDDGAASQRWSLTPFHADPDFKLPEFSRSYKDYLDRRERWNRGEDINAR